MKRTGDPLQLTEAQAIYQLFNSALSICGAAAVTHIVETWRYYTDLRKNNTNLENKNIGDSEYNENPKNPGNPIEIPGIQWEFHESNGNPENPGSTKSAVFSLPSLQSYSYFTRILAYDSVCTNKSNDIISSSNIAHR
jgi:hypothetical protein